ncbi:phosphatase domain-containing putative toxin [Chachezhania sediminis]|uniref:phosphatase domain-containing putative toxin n=1 Tax=Chachezhania sediminis TaxID=2599291 RepID=UPI00131EAD42|nr:dual specificity protein phosphatase family protein [Chachezhania sediminis]
MSDVSELTAPLISRVRMPDRGLNLVLLSCPGIRYAGQKKIASRDFLTRDVQALVDRDVGMLICCLTDTELPLASDDFAATYAAAGIDWRRVPIPDMSPPPADTEDLLDQIFATARGVMARGHAVAIHCMAGLGRTGTVAARLIIDFGMNPAEAIEFVRASHSRAAIETSEQELYLMSGRAGRR